MNFKPVVIGIPAAGQRCLSRRLLLVAAGKIKRNAIFFCGTDSPSVGKDNPVPNATLGD